MALRFQGTGLVIGSAGSALTHGLRDQNLVAQVPTEWGFNFAAAANAAGNNLYRSAAPTSATFSVCAVSGAAGAVDVFCSLPHSIIA